MYYVLCVCHIRANLYHTRKQLFNQFYSTFASFYCIIAFATPTRAPKQIIVRRITSEQDLNLLLEVLYGPSTYLVHHSSHFYVFGWSTKYCYILQYRKQTYTPCVIKIKHIMILQLRSCYLVVRVVVIATAGEGVLGSNPVSGKVFPGFCDSIHVA